MKKLMMKKIIVGDTFAVPETACPRCARKHSAATCIGSHAMPRPGDVTICSHCLNFLIFDEYLQLTIPTKKEQSKIDTNFRCQIMKRVAYSVAVQQRSRN